MKYTTPSQWRPIVLWRAACQSMTINLDVPKKKSRALHPEESFEILDCTRIYKALQIRIALSLNRVGLFSAYNRHNHQETSNVQNSGVRPMHFRLVGAIGPEKTFFSCSQDWIAVSMRAFFGNHCRGIPFARSVYH